MPEFTTIQSDNSFLFQKENFPFFPYLSPLARRLLRCSSFAATCCDLLWRCCDGRWLLRAVGRRGRGGLFKHLVGGSFQTLGGHHLRRDFPDFKLLQDSFAVQVLTGNECTRALNEIMGHSRQWHKNAQGQHVVTRRQRRFNLVAERVFTSCLRTVMGWTA